MPWPIRSTRFGLYNASPAPFGLVVLGTVPAGKRWLVKEWAVYNGAGVARNVYMGLRTGGVFYTVEFVSALASGNLFKSFGRETVLNAGDELAFQTSVIGSILLVVSGAQLG